MLAEKANLLLPDTYSQKRSVCWHRPPTPTPMAQHTLKRCWWTKQDYYCKVKWTFSGLIWKMQKSFTCLGCYAKQLGASITLILKRRKDTQTFYRQQKEGQKLLRESTHTHTFLLYNKQLESAKKKTSTKTLKLQSTADKTQTRLQTQKKKKEKNGELFTFERRCVFSEKCHKDLKCPFSLFSGHTCTVFYRKESNKVLKRPVQQNLGSQFVLAVCQRFSYAAALKITACTL